MPSWPATLLTAGAATYAATQAQKSGFPLDTLVKQVLPSEFGFSSSSSSSGGSEISVLQGEVDRLHKLLADVVKGGRGSGSHGVTVVHAGGGKSGWTLYIWPVALAGSAAYIYYQVRNGASVADFFFVTKKSLLDFRSSVAQSFTDLYEAMRKQKDEFMERIRAVGMTQQQMMAKQNQMAEQQDDIDQRLRSVGDNVDEIRDTASTVRAHVGQLDDKMTLLASGVDRANQGIYLLCATVAEVTRRVGMSNHKATNLLHTYVDQAPQEIEASADSGLRALLHGSDGGAGGAAPGNGIPALTHIEEVPAVPVASGLSPTQSAPLSDTALLYRRESSNVRSGFGLWGSAAANGQKVQTSR